MTQGQKRENRGINTPESFAFQHFAALSEVNVNPC